MNEYPTIWQIIGAIFVMKLIRPLTATIFHRLSDALKVASLHTNVKTQDQAVKLETPGVVPTPFGQVVGY